jgi:hypothetical protein
VTAVRVFVDDAIRGDLPMVCAKSGEPAGLKVRMRQPVGGGIPGVVWLLFFLGPLGIVGLLVAALFSPATEYLTVRIPETEASFARERNMERWRLAALGAGAFVLVYGALRPGMFPVMWLVLSAACFLAAGALTWMLWRQSIGVSIDVTRRWVTLSNVHPRFAAGVQWRELRTHRT